MNKICAVYEPSTIELIPSVWISVKDKLPENGQECLVFVSDFYENEKFKELVILDKDYDENDFSFFSLASFHDEGIYRYWQDTGDASIVKFITHWMPLPEPPKD